MLLLEYLGMKYNKAQILSLAAPQLCDLVYTRYTQDDSASPYPLNTYIKMIADSKIFFDECLGIYIPCDDPKMAALQYKSYADDARNEVRKLKDSLIAAQVLITTKDGKYALLLPGDILETYYNYENNDHLAPILEDDLEFSPEHQKFSIIIQWESDAITRNRNKGLEA